MFHWTNFRSEPNKTTVKDQALYVINAFFRQFFPTISWMVYFLAFLFLVVGIVYFLIDENRKRTLLERRREIRRSQEKPPQKRRPGAAARNHEIYRNVMSRIRNYMEPSFNEACVFRKTRSGTIYGQVVGSKDTDKNSILTHDKEDNASDVDRKTAF